MNKELPNPADFAEAVKKHLETRGDTPRPRTPLEQELDASVKNTPASGPDAEERPTGQGDTPRTDEFGSKWQKPGQDAVELVVEWVEFARQLERELTALVRDRDVQIEMLLREANHYRKMWQEAVPISRCWRCGNPMLPERPFCPNSGIGAPCNAEGPPVPPKHRPVARS
jgi:hypothetical protein